MMPLGVLLITVFSGELKWYYLDMLTNFKGVGNDM
jgi:hypothetical protein